MRIALVFPGQASQEVGMGRTFFDAFTESRDIFERADEALGFSITDLCFNGPDEKLKLTEITQPSILTVSVAIWRALASKLVEAGHEIVCAAGHSLGEYSALVAADSLKFDDAVVLVNKRGRLMQEAVPEGQGAMTAVLGLDARDVDAACADARARSGAVVNLANLNSPGQWVISGSVDGIAAAEALLKERGAKKLIRLPVSAPFHCPLMKPATDGMRPLLQKTEFEASRFPVISNSTADVYPLDSCEYAGVLTGQIESPVRWIETCQRFRLDFGAQCALEVGPGRVLAGLSKRIAPELPVTSVGTVEQMNNALEWLSAGCNTGAQSV